MKTPGDSRRPGLASATFRRLRILILATVLAVVAVNGWRERLHSTQWRVPLFVAIYPIADDEGAVTRAYVAGLRSEQFAEIDGFFAREARRYGIELASPLKTRLQPALPESPPRRGPEAGMLGTVWWSLKLRFWSWRMTRNAVEPADIRVFVLYHDPALTPVVPHSLGMAKGLIGVVYAFATPAMDGGNAVVIAHELLHTLGATDKYDPHTDAPRFPDGYGDPAQKPLFPQRSAELMAGRRVISASRWEQPRDLSEVQIGPATALEIRWRSPPQ